MLVGVEVVRVEEGVMGWREDAEGSYLPHQPHNLSPSSRLEIEVVERGHAANLLVGGAGGADFLRGWHLDVSVCVANFLRPIK